jgi:hypothetical protein
LSRKRQAIDALRLLKPDVYAAGFIILEIIKMRGPESIYDSLYPAILQKKLSISLLYCVKSSLANDPQLRITSFQEMFDALASDSTDFTRNDALLGVSMWIKDYL